jgi:hypothetical protein
VHKLTHLRKGNFEPRQDITLFISSRKESPPKPGALKPGYHISGSRVETRRPLSDGSTAWVNCIQLVQPYVGDGVVVVVDDGGVEKDAQPARRVGCSLPGVTVWGYMLSSIDCCL